MISLSQITLSQKQVKKMFFFSPSQLSLQGLNSYDTKESDLGAITSILRANLNKFAESVSYSNIQILNNRINSPTTTAIAIWNAKDVVIKDNTLTDVASGYPGYFHLLFSFLILVIQAMPYFLGGMETYK